ncbi:MAG TPA: CvpA family protein [Terriglobales bacterium]|nr:CvpA family protein [Terriglobales bacterium]
MNLLDYALIALVAVSVLTAAMKGFVYEVWMMAATVAALAVAAWQYGVVAGWLDWIRLPPGNEVRNFVAFVAIVAGVLLVATIVGRMLRGAVRAVGLGWPDRLLGAGLGLVRGGLLCVAVVAMLTAFPLSPGLVRDSSLAPRLLWGGRALAAVMPAELAARFHAGVARLDEELP